MLTFGSVCSGIEAASVAWEPLGWRAVWLSEIDKAASKVLAYRFPNVPNHGDMLKLAAKVRAREIPAPDILVGGTPCQSFSVAGMRRGLGDPRGQLTIAFIDLANAIDEIRAADGLPPVIIIWENVPGVLTHPDNPFGCFLAGIAGEDDAVEPAGKKWTNAGCVFGPQRPVAWRILDAQYFGLAQRRRRVFVVASAREGFDPAAILLEFDGVRRDSPPSRDAGEGVAGTVDARTTGGGLPGSDGPCGAHDVPAIRGHADGLGHRRLGGAVPGPDGLGDGVDLQNIALSGDAVGTIDTGMARGNRGYGVLDRAPVPPGGDGRAVSQTLDAVLHKGQTMPEKNRFPAVLQPVIESELYSIMPMNSGKDYKARKVEVTQPLMGAGPVGGNQGGDYIVQPLDVLPFDTTQITSPGNFSSPNYGDPSHPLAAGAHPPSVVYSVALRGREGGGTAELGDDLAGCLRASSGGGDKPHVLTPTIAFQERGRSEGRSLEINGDLSYALTAPSGGGRGQERNILDGVTMAVRRLMPVECERLQGFPDNWTAVPVKKVASNKMRPGNSYAEINAEIWQLAADGPRYKQCGNSMATKVMRWIGSRVAWHLSTRLPGHNGGPPLDDFDLMLGLGVPDPMDAVIG